jgi:hypothetical protein
LIVIYCRAYASVSFEKQNLKFFLILKYFLSTAASQNNLNKAILWSTAETNFMILKIFCSIKIGDKIGVLRKILLDYDYKKT